MMPDLVRGGDGSAEDGQAAGRRRVVDAGRIPAAHDRAGHVPSLGPRACRQHPVQVDRSGARPRRVAQTADVTGSDGLIAPGRRDALAPDQFDDRRDPDRIADRVVDPPGAQLAVLSRGDQRRRRVGLIIASQLPQRCTAVGHRDLVDRRAVGEQVRLEAHLTRGIFQPVEPDRAGFRHADAGVPRLARDPGRQEVTERGVERCHPRTLAATFRPAPPAGRHRN